MSIVYFVREGCGSERANQGWEFSLVDIDKAFPHCQKLYAQHPPVFNSDVHANPVSAYRYVVVRVKEGETSGAFNRDGYWYLDGVSPAEFQAMFAVV